MRIALDLQACQTESRHRGIGRYSRALASGLLEQAGPSREYILGLDQTYPESADELAVDFARYVTEPRVLRYQYPVHADANPDAPSRKTGEQLVRAAYAARSPDVLHVNSLFEGYVEHAAGLGVLAGIPGNVSSVTLYDLIPAAFPDLYLAGPARGWYEGKLRDLKRFDVLLCISEATKSDAVRLLGLPEDRLAVIHAGIDAAFLALLQRDVDGAALRSKFDIGKRFVLYTGNDDPRKNLQLAVKAFARVPAKVRAGVQLVLNQVGDERAVRAAASRAGLSRADLVVTGRVSDRDLAGLLRECEVFFFPSLYEGFGLPVLEAMAAGSAAICGDNSSLPEVVGRRDAMFDASSVDAAAGTLARALGDEAFRRSLENDAASRAAAFTWQRSARAACAAWDAALDRRRGRRVHPVAGTSRLRIAMVSPVPGERTGIADYTGELLPALAERMDVDVFTTAAVDEMDPAIGRRYTVRGWQELRRRRQDYDQVVFQVGNSPFHSHMVDLVGDVGGVVVLHDFFLSSMLAYMDQHQGCPGLFARELERSHGRGALQLLAAQGGWDQARRRFPACRRIIEGADGVIVHSAHARELSEQFFPGMPRPPVFEIPQLRLLEEAGPGVRQVARSALGIREGDVLVASFGFLADTKLNLEILEALAIPAIAARDNVRVAFVGELDGGAYGQAVSRAIEHHPLRKRIMVTGFAQPDDYRNYLQACDIAVQLRAGSRGETSRTVLDCLANSTAVVVNDYAAFQELPGDAVAKVPARFEVDVLGATLERLLRDAGDRVRLARHGRRYIERDHAPPVVAGLYEDAIRLAIAAAPERRGGALVRGLASALASGPRDAGALPAIRDSLAVQKQDETFRLFVDLSEVVSEDYGTGIHRVVRNLTRELVLAEGRGMRCLGVALDASGAYAPAEDYLVGTLDLPRSAFDQSFSPRAGDVLFLLDSAWQSPERFLPEIQRMRASGGRVGAMVYDLIPLRFPRYCADFMPVVFERWLRQVVAQCDFVVCITRAVGEDLAAWIRETGAEHRSGFGIGHVRLGCDLVEPAAMAGPPSDRVVKAFGTAGDAVLMVGTVEPRKRHDVALDAFERAWASGCDRRLVIVGKQGWNVEALALRMRQHPEAGRRLFWLEDATDSDLAFAYANAERVLQASDAEGFGLPLVEAALHGRPLLASDLPVFREVAGDAASYFPQGDVEALAGCLLRPPPPAAGTFHPVTWADTAEQAMELITRRTWDHVLA